MRESCVDLVTLLDPKSVGVVHQTVRKQLEKRIVVFNDEHYVLYRFPTRFRAWRFRRLLRLTDRTGVPFQKLVSCQTGEAKDAGFWVVASYEEGDTWDLKRIQPDHLWRLAEALALLHRAESWWNGKLFKLERPSRWLFRSRLMEECAPAIAACETLAGWAAENASVLRPRSMWQLVHGDLYDKNMLMRGDGSICLLDYEFAAYELAGMELAAVLLRVVTGRLKPMRQEFVERYLAASSCRVQQDWNQHAPQYLVFSLMRIVGRSAQKLARTRATATAAHIERAELSMQKLLGDACSMAQAINQGERNVFDLLAAAGR